TEPVPLSRAILPSMQSSTKLRWNSSAPATSHGQPPWAKQAAEARPSTPAPRVSWLGVIEVWLAVQTTSRPASGSTRNTVHQASRFLYVRSWISASVKAVIVLCYSCNGVERLHIGWTQIGRAHV